MKKYGYLLFSLGLLIQPMIGSADELGSAVINDNLSFDLIEKEESSVTVEFMNENGDKLSDNIVLTGKYGESYKTQPKKIDNWIVKEVTGNINGVFTHGERKVTYIYIKKYIGSVTIRHILEEEDGSTLLLAEQILHPISEESYTSEPLDVLGLKVKQIPDNATGEFTEENQVVTYLYERDIAAPVTVVFIDENGNDLADSIVLTGKWGLSYESQPKNISGYELKEIPGNAEGLFSEEEQLVTYVYIKQEEPEVTEPEVTEPLKQDVRYFKSIDRVDDNQLPKTGEEKSKLAFVGIGVSIMTTMIYLFKKKK